MFERHSTTRLRLSKDARDQFGALLVVMRNEYIAGMSAADGWDGEKDIESVSGAGVNYAKMIECIDRLLTRICQSWDQQKMGVGYNILSRALTNAGGRQLATHHIEEATAHYGITRLAGSRDRIKDAGNDKLPSQERDSAGRSFPGESGGIGDNVKHVDARPGRHRTNTEDSGGTGIGGSTVRTDATGPDSRDDE